MFLSSFAFEDGNKIPNKFTCEGWNVNPELSISNIPSAAQSLALVMEDIDSKPNIFTHWIVWNIGPATNLIKEESVPPGSTEGIGTSGQSGYMGPCPKVGEHRYVFRLYALDININLKEGSDRDSFDKAIDGHVLEKAELLGIYKRQ